MLEDFRQELLRNVRLDAEAEGTYTRYAFMNRVGDAMEDAGHLDDFRPGHFANDRPYSAMDGIACNDQEGRLDLILLDLRDQEPGLPSLTATRLDNRLAGLERMLLKVCSENWDADLDETSEAYDCALTIREAVDREFRIRFVLISDGRLSNRVDDLARRGLPGGQHAAIAVWDIERLARLLDDDERDDIVIDFTAIAGGGIPCLPTHGQRGSYEGYLAVVPGSLLADVYQQYGARLLEQNVRSYLQARGKVNKGIRATILNEPGMFFAYNNGITATAQSVDVAQTDEGPRLTSATNLQIVNGGQTTASIFTTRWKDKAALDELAVQMKLAVIPEERLEEVVPNISRYANTQNKVSEADLFSNHPYHIRVEEISRRLWAPPIEGTARETRWFYERARGQYADMRSKLTVAERRRFDAEYPKAQMFNKTDLAKFANVWEQRPQIVSRGAQKNFVAFADSTIVQAWENNDKDFNDAYFRRLVAMAIVFRATEKLVSRADWYEGGYRANIVAYTIARLAHAVTDAGEAFDFERVWRAQEADDRLQELLGSIGASMQQVILQPPEGVRNLSEWAKRDACWKAAKLVRIDTAGLERFCISREASNDTARHARQQRSIDDDLEAQIAVANLSAADREALARFAMDNHIIAPSEHSIMRLLAQGRMLSPKQARKVIGLADRCAVEGCPIRI